LANGQEGFKEGDNGKQSPARESGVFAFNVEKLIEPVSFAVV